MMESRMPSGKKPCPVCSKPMRVTADICGECIKIRRRKFGGKRAGWYTPCTASDNGKHSPNLFVTVVRAESGRLLQKEHCTACNWEREVPFPEDAHLYGWAATSGG